MIKIVKTTAMSYHTMQNKFPMRPKITYKNKVIAYKLNKKFLRIYIAENLKWTTHINTLRLQLCKYATLLNLVKDWCDRVW